MSETQDPVNDLGNTPAAQAQQDALAEQADGFVLGDAEKIEGQYEKVPYQRTQEEQDALAKVVAGFEESRHDASFSKRNPDLGKMINCSLCGMRHRVHDPVLLNSTAHGPQVFGDLEYPSRTAVFAKRRFHPHMNKKKLEFVQGVWNLVPVYGVEGDEDPKLEIVKGIVKARLLRKYGRAFSLAMGVAHALR